MTAQEYHQLKVGDRVYDKFKHQYMEVITVYNDVEFAIRFQWVATVTIYEHGCHDIEKLD